MPGPLSSLPHEGLGTVGSRAPVFRQSPLNESESERMLRLTTAGLTASFSYADKAGHDRIKLNECGVDSLLFLIRYRPG